MKDNKENIEEILAKSSGKRLTTDPTEVKKPLIVRGVVKKDHVERSIQIGRSFYYIDTGYFGNFPSPGNPKGQKKWHRIVKNENQQSKIIPNVPADRWNRIKNDDPRYDWHGWKNYDKKILLVMPNPKACRYYNVDFETWTKNTKMMIQQHCDLPVEVRIKGSRTYRNYDYSIYDAFDSGVYATVTMNSMAALESVLYGIPAFVTVPCAASPLATVDNLENLKNPFKPDLDTIQAHCNALAYGQFTLDEIQDGTAYKLVEKYQ